MSGTRYDASNMWPESDAVLAVSGLSRQKSSWDIWFSDAFGSICFDRAIRSSMGISCMMDTLQRTRSSRTSHWTCSIISPMPGLGATPLWYLKIDSRSCFHKTMRPNPSCVVSPFKYMVWPRTKSGTSNLDLRSTLRRLRSIFVNTAGKLDPRD